ncbi:vacuolar protein sorting/targeting protein 10 [Cylindrobasidium torrendii FP15055 ss-10]|uniref:Vacuolar protein sorting/targeting protein 10 n=1 Tax=Cylindrobasidium torrendii FP15055 ss-10 TaxID=1314674 RepID=A0A0D7B9F5_9AGAR|nr:vacuolar protein sorting/targeting protein 10 [Cylindrobasidium torrendii FP15055 ss-10]
MACAGPVPKHTITSFSNLPGRLFFFDDSEAALYLDAMAGTLYVSQDEGKSWGKASNVPEGEATMVIEHPFDNRMAFLLTRGKRHYRTDDRGKSWRAFDMPLAPALVAKPLSFHSDPKKFGYILYQGTKCERIGWGQLCHDETYYTKDAFGDTPQLLLSETTRCQFAHSSSDFKHEAPDDLVYCVAYDTTAANSAHSLSSSRLFSSTDFFDKDFRVEELGIGKNSKGVLAFAIVSKFAIVALKDLSSNSNGEMLLYVTVDTKTWAKAQFPKASSAQLRENAYTIVESTTHSLAVDVVLQDKSSIGTLFVSNSNGTFFVESLRDTNRNTYGFVDYERLYGVDGVGIANVVSNAEEVEARGATKLIKTVVTFDDGSSWQPLSSDGGNLHLHSVTNPHNFGRVFSSPAPGLAMGVGSVGDHLLPYEDCDLYLTTDAGGSWKRVREDAQKYEFGDSGSVMVTVNDETGVSKINYSLDFGNTWKEYDVGLKFRAKGLTTVPDSTSQKFLLLAQVAKGDQKNGIGRYVTIFLDFAKTRTRKCGDNDFETWYARPSNSECLMGHKQYYKRRKANVDCYVGDKFLDPIVHEENCACTDTDYECDFNYVRDGDKCVPVGPEPIPAGTCLRQDQTYMGSSGWRKIPGNTCTGGNKDEKAVHADTRSAQPEEGEVVHQSFEFQARILQHSYFKDSTTIIVLLDDHTIWQSSNEGYTWNQLVPNESVMAFYHHPYSPDRCYILTAGKTFYATTDYGRSWNAFSAPNPPNNFHAQVLRFQPDSDKIIWLGSADCENSMSDSCRIEAHWSRDNGRKWTLIDQYVRNCAWARDTKLNADPTEIMCESYATKKGNQRFFLQNNALELIEGQSYYQKNKKLFDQVVGFAKFSEFLVVAELVPSKNSLELQVSLDGVHFASGEFPPSMRPETHAYTVLESSTGSLFLHMTMQEKPFWGTLLKSNSNGTYFGIGLEKVNRDDRGYVDFEKMIGLDGIALVNVVGNADEAVITGQKKLQTRITHNDGGSWKKMVPPTVDSQGNKYACDTVNCALHVHGYTERRDPRATYSSPSIVGLLMAVGNVGESLAGYTDSDTFLSRDAGFTWEEVHKDAHLWEFGDSGSILVMANDEESTDHVLFSTDEGKSWREYKFSEEKMRVLSIVTVPSDTSRKFILFAQWPKTSGSVAVHLDFSQLTRTQCKLSIEDPGNDDFELWSPSEERSEQCLFGRQTLYHRRVRESNCYVGNQPKAEVRVEKNCACTRSDFECEFNYVKNDNDECVLVPGTTPRPDDDSCSNGESYWYERTPYRMIPYSSCEGGTRHDRGAEHICPGFSGHSALFWWFMILIPCGLAAIIGTYLYKRSGLARGQIRLPGDGGGLPLAYRGDMSTGSVLDTVASVPWFIIGVAAVGWEWLTSNVAAMGDGFRARRGYRNVPIDEDAQILRFEEEREQRERDDY